MSVAIDLLLAALGGTGGALIVMGAIYAGVSRPRLRKAAPTT